MSWNTYAILFWSGVLLWVLENDYFGWNLVAQSGAERLCDTISGALMIVGLIGSIATKAAEGYLKEELKGRKQKKGFAVLSPEKRSEISRLGGIAAHAQGKGHEFTPEEAKVAGRKGGLARGKAQ